MQPPEHQLMSLVFTWWYPSKETYGPVGMVLARA